MAVSDDQPISAENLAAALHDAVGGTVLYDCAGSPTSYQVTLPVDPNDFDVIEVYWQRLNFEGSSLVPKSAGSQRVMTPLINGMCLPSATPSGSAYNAEAIIMNVSGKKLTLTTTMAGQVSGNNARFQRVVGYRSGGGAAPS